MGSQMAEIASRVINSNTFVNICLIGCFSVLGLRSFSQQNLIESLEAENTKIKSSNKAIKKTIWDSKQQLYSEASSVSAVVPLSRLRSIYGEVVVSPSSGEGSEIAGKASAKIIV